MARSVRDRDAERERCRQQDEAELRRQEWLAAPDGGALGLTDEALDASRRPVWSVKHVAFGNGLHEAVAWRRTPDPLEDMNRAYWPKSVRGEGNREANDRRNGRRAVQSCRYRCKGILANSMWTLTYRENVTDREQVLRHLKEFARRVRGVLPGWKYVAVLERQKRGAWHIHLATHALDKYVLQRGVVVKSWNAMRAIWRAVVGLLGGNFDESKASGRYKRGTTNEQRERMRCGAIAAYIAKYVAKSFGDEPELDRKRYSCSMGIGDPTKQLTRLWDAADLEALLHAYALLPGRVVRCWYDPVSRVFFAESEESTGVG